MGPRATESQTKSQSERLKAEFDSLDAKRRTASAEGVLGIETPDTDDRYHAVQGAS